MPTKKTTNRANSGKKTRTIARKSREEDDLEKIDRVIDRFLKKEELEKARDKTLKFLETHPITTVAVSAAVGASVALIASSLTSRKEPERSFKDNIRGKLRDLLE